MKKISWFQATIFSVISFIPSFFLFFLLEIIWGDIFKETLSYENYKGRYFNLNLILITGLMFVFAISLLTNIFLFREHSYQSKLMSNVLTLILTVIILFFMSWLLVVVILSEFYNSLTILEKINCSTYFFVLIAIYLLPSPIWFWIISLITYHVILIFFIKYFFKSKKSIKKSSSSKKSNKKSRKKKVNIRKYEMM